MKALKNYNILYMEDDNGLARLLQKSLGRKGYTVDIASNGKDGLNMIEKSKYDILLIDYNMPILGGVDVIKALAKSNNEDNTLPIPAIMITAHGNENVAVEAMKLGAYDYIVKDSGTRYLELIPMVIEQAMQRQEMIEEQKRMFKLIAESEERYKLLVEMSPDGIAIYTSGKINFVNSAGIKLLGARDMRELIGREIVEFIEEEYKENIKKVLNIVEYEKSKMPWICAKIIRPDSRIIDVEIAAVPLQYSDMTAGQIIFRDITERKEAEQRLEYLAHFDILTSLPNRTLFFDRLDQLHAQAKRTKQSFALLFIDLDRFKYVNDTFGHHIGDMLLKETASRFNSCVRESDTVARMGGDEFTVILSNIKNREDVEIVASKIVQSIMNPYKLDSYDCSVSASIGISIFPTDSYDIDMLVKMADVAMYHAKESGRNNYQFYDASLEQV
ncbi:MAG: diguanylate cyclase [Nitrospirae bacterium]|nr:diguanylate cyclase [Nitrospirota bacterium]